MAGRRVRGGAVKRLGDRCRPGRGPRDRARRKRVSLRLRCCASPSTRGRRVAAGPTWASRRRAAGHARARGRASRYYSVWDHRATILTDPVRDQWSVKVHHVHGQHRQSTEPDDGAHEPDHARDRRPPVNVGRAEPRPRRRGRSRRPRPPAGPARSRPRSPAAGSAPSGTTSARPIVPGSVRIRRWTVDFGDGTTSTIAPSSTSPQPPLDHARVRRGHVHGHGHRAGHRVAPTPRSSPPMARRTSPPSGWSLDITNAASGVSGLPVEYVTPVATAAASPSGTLPDGTTAAADPDGLTEIWWPRGLPCDLFVRAVIEREGFMRSGGVVIGAGPDAPRPVPLHPGHQRRPGRDAHRARTGPPRRSGSSGTRRCPGPGPTRSASSSSSRPPTTTAPSGPPAWRARSR